MTKAELILQFIRTLIWPIIFVFGVFMFHGQIGALLEGEIEAEIFGVKVKGKNSSGLQELAVREDSLRQVIVEMQDNAAKLASLNQSLAASNEELKDTIEEQNNKLRTAAANDRRKNTRNRSPITPVKVPETQSDELAKESERVAANLSAQVDQSFRYTAGSKYDVAKKQEVLGFEALIKDDFSAALDHFEKATKAWPSYHNVSEIARLLRSKGRELSIAQSKEKAGQEVYQEIWDKYSWGMPEEIKAEMRKKLGKK